jgi:hypothetical protein
MIHRRGVLSGAALLAAAPLLPAAAQTGASAPPTLSREEKIARAAAESRMRLDYRGGRFSGPAWEWLLARGRESQFFLLGEEHGIAENAKLAAQLFAALVPSGYSKVAVEISAPMAEELDRAVTAGGAAGLKRLFEDPGSVVAFFGMREEAEWLAAARAALPGRQPFLWGNDYEVGADRRLIALLKPVRKPVAARQALDRLEAASHASWARYAQTHDFQHIYSFAGDPALVRAVRAAWPKPDPRSAWILDTLEETFAINRLWVERRAWESNERRGAFMRANFLRHWRLEKAAGRSPRVFLKYGASHMVRGRNTTETFDLGSLVPEVAAIEGGKAFQLLVLPGKGSSVAVLDPTTFGYKPVEYDGDYSKGLEPIAEQAWPDAFTLFDTHKLRPLLGFSRTPAHPQLMNMVHGYDAVLILSGSTPSHSL